ncbi:MAG: hypothetical protein IJV14_01000 [Lachnospiraceae bacterium]|nr:hypothetical protein [Lachnospiraceae bacterium]
MRLYEYGIENPECILLIHEEAAVGEEKRRNISGYHTCQGREDFGTKQR